MSQPTPQPVLVYNRIDANKRKIAVLFVLFAVLLLPIAGFAVGIVVANLLYHLPKRFILKTKTFEADADATLLTQDPEALALALAKIAVVGGVIPDVNPAIARLFIADPFRPASFLPPSGCAAHFTAGENGAAWALVISPTREESDGPALVRRFHSAVVLGSLANAVSGNRGVGVR